MPYDVFISYARRDNERGQVAALKSQIEESFRAFSGRGMRTFFDTNQIEGMDDWRQKIQRSLRESQLFLAVLSPNYLKSPYCRWEWEDYVRYEAMRQCLHEGIAPIFFVTLPEAADPRQEQAVAHWIEEIRRRQSFDLRPWYDVGERALDQAHVRTTLEQLHASIRQRLDRSDRARKSPNDLGRHNPAFVGRVRELTALRDALSKNKLGVVGAREGQMPGRATVQGLGGMGKTELALAYAHAFGWDYPGGRWQIPCEHHDDLRVALLHLAHAGALSFAFTEEEEKNIALAFERVLQELNRRERCLLILDNVSEPNLLQPENLDRLPRDGRVDLVVTTRLAPRAIPGSAQEQHFIAVDELPEEDALALMRSHQPEGRFGSEEEDQEARKIVQLLRGFTLAVETAAIYLGRDTSPDDACRRYRERLSPALLRESEAAATDPVVAVRHRVRSLEETLAFTLGTLSPEALHLLEIASQMPADHVPVPWLKSLGASRFPDFANENQAVFREETDQLLGLRLFQSGTAVSADGRPLVVRIHRLVQEIVKKRMPPEECTKLDVEVLDLEKKRAQFILDHFHERPEWELEPLAAAASQRLDEGVTDGPILACTVGTPLRLMGAYAEAKHLISRAVERARPGSENADSYYPTALSHLAGLLKETNHMAQAETLYRETLRLLKSRREPDELAIAVESNNLAELLRETHQFEEAERYYRDVLPVFEAVFGATHPHVARVLNNFALLLSSTGRLVEGERLFRRAIAIVELQVGPDHPEIAIRLDNLGMLLRRMNRKREAESLHRRALEIFSNHYPSGHHSIATSLNNLAVILSETGRIEEAEHCFGRAITIVEASNGVDHPMVADYLQNLAQLLHETDRLKEAEPHYRRALRIFEQSFGLGHPKAALTRTTLAALLRTMGRLSEAEPLLRDALAIFERSGISEAQSLASGLNELGLLLQATNRPKEAEHSYRRALSIDEATVGPNHPKVAIRLLNLGDVLIKMGRTVEAEPIGRRMLEILMRDAVQNGQKHAEFDKAYHSYASLLAMIGFNHEEIHHQIKALAAQHGMRLWIPPGHKP